MAKTFYICYFSVREPLVQTQVIPYLLEIMKDGIEVSLLTFEPGGFGTATEEAAVREELAGKGIDWHWLRYHKRPSAPATAYDVFAGAWYTRKLIKKKKFDVLHGRVHIPTLMAAIARKFSSHKPKLLFDIRGFFPEEYTDAGIWPEGGWLYRSAKRVEKWLMKESDGFVVLTEKARSILFPESRGTGFDKTQRPVEVIPCCVDFDNRFSGDAKEIRRHVREELGLDGRRVIVYAGSFGGWYLSDEMLDLLSEARREDPSVFAMILTQRDTEKVRDSLQERGFGDRDYLVESVAPGEIAEYLNAADTALSFIKPSYSKRASSPTKLAEYLACGLPIISNRGVGDVDELIEQNRVGVMLDGMSEVSYAKALRDAEALGDVDQLCRETARREFDLERVGGERYRRLYERLAGQ